MLTYQNMIGIEDVFTTLLSFEADIMPRLAAGSNSRHRTFIAQAGTIKLFREGNFKVRVEATGIAWMN